MKKRIIFGGGVWLLLLLVGCSIDTPAEGTKTIMPSPTTHPYFSSETITPEATTDETVPAAEATALPGEGVTSADGGILNVQAVPGEVDAMISWVTTSPSTSSVAYGQTEAYELGQVKNDLPLKQHVATLTSLEPESTYYYQITTVSVETNQSSVISGTLKTTSRDPLIDVWYGLEQNFGHIGTPQRWINILGNVADMDGVASLDYSLNGSVEAPLSIGPDFRRLANEGDFNIDIDRTRLNPGLNEVVIRATDTLSNQRLVTVTVNYEDDNVWPGNYAIDWSEVANLQDAVEIVDGLWTVEDGTVRTAESGYERMLAIGDIAWTDYEITVPVTLNDVNMETGFDSPDQGPGLGILARWTGHTDFPVANWQPKAGKSPFGALAGYYWNEPDSISLRLQSADGDFVDMPASLPIGKTYWYKLRVQTQPDDTQLYSFKTWPDGRPEPEEWSLTAPFTGVTNGSLILYANQVDASFGNVKVTQLAPMTETPFIPELSGTGFFTVSVPILDTSITGTLPITGTSPITGTVPITDTGASAIFSSPIVTVASCWNCALVRPAVPASEANEALPPLASIARWAVLRQSVLVPQPYHLLG